MKWFGAIGLFKHTYKNPEQISKFEERTVIVSSKDVEQAEKAIIEEFSDYASEELGIEFLGEYEISEIDTKPGEKAVEVSSLMRISALPNDEYIERYWDDLTPESCEDNGWSHVWHKKDDKHSGCYNCCEIRNGQLWK